MNVNYINPFIETSADIFDKAANIFAQLGRPYLQKTLRADDKIVVSVGLIGELSGYVYMSMSTEDAIYVAGKMMNNDSVRSLDDISTSAIKELMNMIIGNTATLFSNRGIQINMTPPNLFMGSGMQISALGSVMLCAPIILDHVYKLEMAITLAT